MEEIEKGFVETELLGEGTKRKKERKFLLLLKKCQQTVAGISLLTMHTRSIYNIACRRCTI